MEGQRWMTTRDRGRPEDGGEDSERREWQEGSTHPSCRQLGRSATRASQGQACANRMIRLIESDLKRFSPG